MNLTFAQYETHRARLALVELLQQDADYEVNEAVLQSALQSVGHALSTDALRTQCEWLCEQELVTTRSISDLLIIKLTRRGEDVALGRAQVPGVARPRPT